MDVAGVPPHLAVTDVQRAIRTLHLSGMSRRGMSGGGYPKVVSLTADNAFEGNRQVVIQQALCRAGVSQPGCPVWLVALRAMFVALEHSLQRDGATHACNDRLKLVARYLGYDDLGAHPSPSYRSWAEEAGSWGQVGRQVTARIAIAWLASRLLSRADA